MCGKRSVGVFDLREEAAADVQRLEKSIFCQAGGRSGGGTNQTQFSNDLMTLLAVELFNSRKFASTFTSSFNRICGETCALGQNSSSNIIRGIA